MGRLHWWCILNRDADTDADADADGCVGLVDLGGEERGKKGRKISALVCVCVCGDSTLLYCTRRKNCTVVGYFLKSKKCQHPRASSRFLRRLATSNTFRLAPIRYRSRRRLLLLLALLLLLLALLLLALFLLLAHLDSKFKPLLQNVTS